MARAAEVNAEFERQASHIGLRIQCLGDGDINSEIALVSEAPGEREVALRMPQVGGGGQLLWKCLLPYKITRKGVWTTNVVKRQLLHADDSKTTVNRSELQHWHGMLDWELRQMPNLKYIVALGTTAMEFFNGEDKILSWRGSVVPWQGKHVLIALNPAFPIREPRWDIVFRFDIQKLHRLLQGKFSAPVITGIINPSPDEAIRWIDKMQDEHEPISLDIETVAQETACIGLANDSHTGCCINFRTKDANHYSVEDELRVRRRLQSLFSDTRVRFITQNGNFDASWLWWKDRLRLHAVWFDTLLAHHTLYPPLPHSLGFLTAQYTDHPYYKDEKDAWKQTQDVDAFWLYNIKDCCITKMVQLKEHNELRAQKLEDFFFNHVMKLQPELVTMTVGGVLVDRRLKEDLSTSLAETVDGKLRAFYDAVSDCTGDPEYHPNPGSPKQLADLFFSRLRLVGRGTSTDEANRVRMRRHPRTSDKAKIVIDRVGEYAKDKKILSTYITSAIDYDGRIRCEWKQFGTKEAPGRLSSSATWWETGMNMQNQPRSVRKIYIADPGYRFVYFDLAQAEARVVGWLANITKWKEDFERARTEGGFDCHRSLASAMFGVPYDDVPEVDDNPDGSFSIRYIAKRCRHGLNYRMGYDRLAETTGLPIIEAKAAYDIYHRINPELRRWWEQLIQTATRDRELWTPLGRRWKLLERITDEALESIVAFIPQSTIGDKVTSVIYRSHADPDWDVRARICLNIHDALIALVPDEPAALMTTTSIMKRHAESPIYIGAEPLIIPADISISEPGEDGIHRWSTLKKVKHIYAAEAVS
jgi:uracil-DNA glycosylase family 4